MMLPITPKEISKKIYFWENDVFVSDDVKLTNEEQSIFEKFREDLNKNNKARFED